MTENSPRHGTSSGFPATVALTTVIVGVLAYLESGTGKQGQSGSPLLFFFESVVTFLPIGAGLIAAQTRRISLSALVGVVVVVTGLMVAQDFLPPSELTREKRAVVYQPLTGQWDVAGSATARWQEGGTLRIAADYAMGRFDRLDSGPPYDEASQNIHASYGVTKLAYLLLPFITVGFVLGARRWVAHNVMFRTRSGERLFLFVMAWVVGPAVPMIVWTVGEMTRAVVLASDSSLWTIAAPHLVFATLAALAWKGALEAGTTGFDIDEV